MKLSKSKINSYLKCPREFKFQYIDEIEVAPNKYMLLGSDVHSIAEKFVDKFGHEIEGINISHELDKIAYDDLNLGYDLSHHIDSLEYFFREVFVDGDYKLFSFEEYLYDRKNNFSGICDIILERSDNKLVVIDYKTSKSSSFSKYRLELCYYKMLVENVYHKRVASVGIFFTGNSRLRLLDVSDGDKRKCLPTQELCGAVDTLRHVRNEVNARNFPKKEQYLCRFCTYKNICSDPFYNFR